MRGLSPENLLDFLDLISAWMAVACAVKSKRSFGISKGLLMANDWDMLRASEPAGELGGVVSGDWGDSPQYDD